MCWALAAAHLRWSFGIDGGWSPRLWVPAYRLSTRGWKLARHTERNSNIGGAPAWRAIAASLIASAVLLGGCDRKENTYAPPPPPKVIVTKPTIETVTDNLDFTGNTAAFETVKLVARVEGYLQQIHFQDGQRVNKGNLLFTIQQDQYKANVEKAQSDIDAAKAKLDYAETEYKRFGRLFEQKAAAATQVDQWKFERDSARAALEAAQANLVTAKLNLSYTMVTAPFDGRMGRHLIDAGNMVGAGGQETVLAEINRIDPMYVYFTINERDLLRVTEREDGQSAGAAPRQNKQVLYMGLSTQPGYPYKGELDYAGITVNPQTGTLQLRGIFPNSDSRIIPGLFARVRAPYAQTHDAVLVPAEAVGSDQQGNYVLTVDDKSVVARKSVEAGQQVGEKRVISSGLKGDEWVIVEGLLRAIPGREVTPERAGGAAPESGSSPASATTSEAAG
jgi:RND family efflux transporter MFP subunit